MLRGSFGAVDRFSNIDETTFTLEPGRSSVMLNQCSQPGSAEAEAETVEGQGTLAFFPREEGASTPQDTGEPLAAPQKLGQVLVASNDHWLANRNARQRRLPPAQTASGLMGRYGIYPHIRSPF